MRWPCHLDHSAKGNSQTRILTREWILIFGIFGLLASSLVISQLSKIRDDQTLQSSILQANRPISITITGAVQRPGTYSVKPGTTLKDLLKESPLAADAQRKKVPFKKVFHVSQTIHIPNKKEQF